MIIILAGIFLYVVIGIHVYIIIDIDITTELITITRYPEEKDAPLIKYYKFLISHIYFFSMVWPAIFIYAAYKSLKSFRSGD